MEQLKEEDQRLVVMMRHPISGIGLKIRKVKDGGFLIQKKSSCFSGKEAVTWVVEQLGLESRDEAKEKCENLKSVGVFTDIAGGDQEFQDEDLSFYEFTLKKRVVIIGGGFGGGTVAKSLQNENLDLTLIDQKPYFLNSLHIRAFSADPSTWNDKIRSQHTNYLNAQCKVVLGNAIRFNNTHVFVKPLAINPSGEKSDSVRPPTNETDEKKKNKKKKKKINTKKSKKKQKKEEQDLTPVAYDYLIVATGSRYTQFWESTDKLAVINPLDLNQTFMHSDAISNAKSVTVIGGGPVGVEIAGEFLIKFPDKTVHLVSSRETLLERMSREAHESVSSYYSTFKNLKLHLGCRVKTIEGNKVQIDNGEEIETDLVFSCVGVSPNTEIFTNSQPFFNDLENLNQEVEKEKEKDNGKEKDKVEEGLFLDENRLVKVLGSLQLPQDPRVFVLGDITNLAEEKLAYNAIKHAEVVVKNIVNMEQKRPVVNYKAGLVVTIVTLGPKKAIMVKVSGENSTLLMQGTIPSKMKSMIGSKISRDFK